MKKNLVKFVFSSIILKSQYSDRSELCGIPPVEGLDLVDAAAVGVVVAHVALIHLGHADIHVVPCEGGPANVNLEENIVCVDWIELVRYLIMCKLCQQVANTILLCKQNNVGQTYI